MVGDLSFAHKNTVGNVISWAASGFVESVGKGRKASPLQFLSLSGAESDMIWRGPGGQRKEGATPKRMFFQSITSTRPARAGDPMFA